MTRRGCIGLWAVWLALMCPGAVFAAPATCRAGVPSPADQHRVQSLLRQLYKAEYARTAAADRADLARRFLDQAQETLDDPAGRYILLQEASRLAAAAGHAALSLRVLDELGRAFEVDALELKAAALQQARISADSQGAQVDVAESALGLIDEAIQRDNDDLAQRMAALAESSAQKSRQLSVAMRVTDRARELAVLRRESEEAAKAMAILAQRPDDPQARLAAGRYRCFIKRQWDRGLALLSGCSDGTLRDLAQSDLGAPQDPAAQARLAGSWWEYSLVQTWLARRAIQERSAGWYRQALPRLTGLSREVARKRLEEYELTRLREQGLAPGLLAELHKGQKLDQKVLHRVDAQIDFDWGKEAPADGLPKDGFSIRWSGKVNVPAAGKYTLILIANSGGRLAMDGTILIDSPTIWRKRGGEKVELELSAGLHAIRLDYWDGGGEAKARLLWIVPGSTTEQPVPANCLFHESLRRPGDK